MNSSSLPSSGFSLSPPFFSSSSSSTTTATAASSSMVVSPLTFKKSSSNGIKNPFKYSRLSLSSCKRENSSLLMQTTRGCLYYLVLGYEEFMKENLLLINRHDPYRWTSSVVRCMSILGLKTLQLRNNRGRLHLSTFNSKQEDLLLLMQDIRCDDVNCKGAENSPYPPSSTSSCSMVHRYYRPNRVEVPSTLALQSSSKKNVNYLLLDDCDIAKEEVGIHCEDEEKQLYHHRTGKPFRIYHKKCIGLSCLCGHPYVSQCVDCRQYYCHTCLQGCLPHCSLFFPKLQEKEGEEINNKKEEEKLLLFISPICLDQLRIGIVDDTDERYSPYLNPPNSPCSYIKTD